MRELIIDKEFESLIPPLLECELEHLEQSLKRDGCLDTIKIWKDNNTILDGHNRYKICTKNSIQFTVFELEMADRYECVEWIIQNQLSRRNLNQWQLYEMSKALEKNFRDMLKEHALHNKQQAASKTRAQKTDSVLSGLICLTSDKTTVSEPIDVGKQVAEKIGISKDSYFKAKKIDELADNDVKEQLRSGKMKINTAYKEVMVKERNVRVSEPKEPAEPKYNVFIVDPKWDDPDTSSKNTMDVTEIKRLPVRSKSEDDAVLFLWVCNTRIPEALDIIRYWGFTYRTNIVWVRSNRKGGKFVTNMHDLVFVATKGVFEPLTNRLPDSALCKVGSYYGLRPREIYEIAEKLYPHQKYIEICANESCPKHWEAYGPKKG